MNEEMPISGGPNVYQKGADTFFIHREGPYSDQICDWVFDHIDSAHVLYESETSEFSPFESYTFLRYKDVVMFKLFWFGK